MLQKLLKRLGIVVIFIFFINTLATFFYWYYSIWWFDMPMHFMGGLFAILLVIFVAERYFNFRNRTAAHTALEQIIFLILVAVLVGIVWEYFEIVVNNIIGMQQFSIFDTFSDLFFDLAGIALGSLYVFMRYPFFHNDKV